MKTQTVKDPHLNEVRIIDRNYEISIRQDKDQIVLTKDSIPAFIEKLKMFAYTPAKDGMKEGG